MNRMGEIRERVEKATPGPWTTDEWYGDYSVRDSGGRAIASAQACYPEGAVGLEEHDATFMAHAREDIPYLLERIDELERDNEKLKGECEKLHAVIQRTIHPGVQKGSG